LKSSAGSSSGVVRVATVAALVLAILAGKAAITSARREAAFRTLSSSHGVPVPVLKVAFEKGWSLKAARAAAKLTESTFGTEKLTRTLVERAVGVADTTEVRPQKNYAVQPKKQEAAKIPTDYSSAVNLANLKAAHLAQESTDNAVHLKGGRTPIGKFTAVEERRLRFWRKAQQMLSLGEQHDLSQGMAELLKARGGARIGVPLVTRDSLNPATLERVRRSLQPKPVPRNIKPSGFDKGVAFNPRGAAKVVRRLPRG